MLRTVEDYDFVCVKENSANGQRSLHAQRGFAADTLITIFNAVEALSAPTYLTVQKDDGVHITLSPSFLQYVNHSCAPNVFFDTRLMQFVALKNILTGDELTFFYPSTEWEMAQAFECCCGSINCLGRIQGAAFLSSDVLVQYRLTDFIQRKLREQAKRA